VVVCGGVWGGGGNQEQTLEYRRKKHTERRVEELQRLRQTQTRPGSHQAQAVDAMARILEQETGSWMSADPAALVGSQAMLGDELDPMPGTKCEREKVRDRPKASIAQVMYLATYSSPPPRVSDAADPRAYPSDSGSASGRVHASARRL
jgi:hypothetical protein